MGGLTGGGSSHRDPGAPDGFLAELARWSARDRVSRSAAERSRTRSLVEQSAAGATWAGVLVDLAEAGAVVTLWAGTGSKLGGRLVGTARDFVVVEDRRCIPFMVRTAAVTALTPGSEPDPGSGPAAPLRPGGQRRPPLDISLAGALDALAAGRTPVVVRSGPDAVAGVVIACGEDVITVRADAGRRPVYLPVSAVTWVEMR